MTKDTTIIRTRGFSPLPEISTCFLPAEMFNPPCQVTRLLPCQTSRGDSDSMELWHITLVTHNSRVSQRMIEYNVERGEPLRLDSAAELIITSEIAKIIGKHGYQIYAYNICVDHVHILLKCAADAVPDVVKTIKALSSMQYKKSLGIQDDEKFHLWAQKFNRWLIESDEQLYNTMAYIISNRRKHGLPEIQELDNIISGMVAAGECGKEVLKQKIDAIDVQNDALVYEPYGLTEEDDSATLSAGIKVVEGKA
ncbi:MAG: transposase [Spirochaetes bacterium]|nr:transposase [Spirochaetota bacterium]